MVYLLITQQRCTKLHDTIPTSLFDIKFCLGTIKMVVSKSFNILFLDIGVDIMPFAQTPALYARQKEQCVK